MNWITSIAVDPGNSDVVYFTAPGDNTYTYKGVYKSINGGGSWQVMNTGITNYNVGPIVIDPNNSSVLYLGSKLNTAPLYKSTNGGANWILSSDLLTYPPVKMSGFRIFGAVFHGL